MAQNTGVEALVPETEGSGLGRRGERTLRTLVDLTANDNGVGIAEGRDIRIGATIGRELALGGDVRSIGEPEVYDIALVVGHGEERGEARAGCDDRVSAASLVRGADYFGEACLRSHGGTHGGDVRAAVRHTRQRMNGNQLAGY